MTAPRPRCVLCGSAEKLQQHHFAGHNFELTVALCDPCHLPITVGLRRLKIDTTGKFAGLAGLVHSLRATCYFQWMLLAHLDKWVNKSKP
jgi:hypothetical protein